MPMSERRVTIQIDVDLPRNGPEVTQQRLNRIKNDVGEYCIESFAREGFVSTRRVVVTGAVNYFRYRLTTVLRKPKKKVLRTKTGNGIQLVG